MKIPSEQTVIDNAIKALDEYPCEEYNYCKDCPLDGKEYCIADIVAALYEAKGKVIERQR